jgi:hypothetical protein
MPIKYASRAGFVTAATVIKMIILERILKRYSQPPPGEELL